MWIGGEGAGGLRVSPDITARTATQLNQAEDMSHCRKFLPHWAEVQRTKSWKCQMPCQMPSRGKVRLVLERAEHTVTSLSFMHFCPHFDKVILFLYFTLLVKGSRVEM